jgi:hypothetical protein
MFEHSLKNLVLVLRYCAIAPQASRFHHLCIKIKAIRNSPDCIEDLESSSARCEAIDWNTNWHIEISQFEMSRDHRRNGDFLAQAI